MAVYKQTFDTRSLSAGNYHVNFDVEEHDVYGSGRLGIRKGDDDGKYQMTFAGTKTSGVFSALTYSGASASLSRTHFFREIGNKVYEIANHLGNVLVTVSDKRLPYSTSPSSPSTVSRYIADVLSYTDYYAFGAPETGRSGGDSYRYGMNGMEQDADVKGEKRSYTTEYREYDPRVGRWFSPDPVVKDYESPYVGFANNSVVFSDPSGLDPGDGPGAAAGKSARRLHDPTDEGVKMKKQILYFVIPPTLQTVVTAPTEIDIPNKQDRPIYQTIEADKPLLANNL